MFIFLSMFLMNFIFFILWVLQKMNIMTFLMEINFFNFSSIQNMMVKMEKTTILFFFIVILISSMIFLYSKFYMSKSNYNTMFLWILFLFISSMLILILANNMMLIILGWDGLGISSFLLVVFYNNLFSLRSGMATFLTNRLGDLFLILSIIFLMSTNFISPLSSLIMNNSYSFFFIFFLVLSAMTKSAQIPFSAWLPAAMAAPTPVSSLVHSSTLVTAGIFLMSQFSMFFQSMYLLTMIMSVLAISLSLFSGSMAFFETDFKKMIAMSTLSQLGLMGFILFNKSNNITLFHIMSHALFKSLLFLSAGVMILYNLGNQDMRLKTSFKKNFFFISILLFVTNFSLMGFPFTSGFFSKDMILLEMYNKGLNIFLLILLISACMMTVLYSINSLNLTCNYMYNMNSFSTQQNFKLMFLPIMVLTPLMLTFGKMMFYTMDGETYEPNIMKKIMGLILICTIIFFLWMVNFKYKNLTKMSQMYSEFFLSMTNMNWTSNNFFTKNFNKMFNMSPLDNNWWEMLGKTGSEMFFKKSINNTNNFNLKFYTMFFLISTIIIFMILLMIWS